MVVGQHGGGHPADSDASVGKHSVNEERHDVDGVLDRVLARIAGNRMYGPETDLSVRIVEERDQPSEGLGIGDLIDDHRTPASHLPAIVAKSVPNGG